MPSGRGDERLQAPEAAAIFYTSPSQSYDDCDVPVPAARWSAAGLEYHSRTATDRGFNHQLAETGIDGDLDDDIDEAQMERPQLTQTPKDGQIEFDMLETHAKALLFENQRLKRARDRASGIRDRVIYAWQGCKDSRGFVAESQSELIQVIAEVIELQMPAALRSKLTSLYDKVCADNFQLDARAAKTGKLERKLMRIEYAMQQREMKIGDLTEDLLRALQRQRISVASDEVPLSGPPSMDLSTGSDEAKSEKAPSTQVHPALEAYYDRSGNVRIYQERLAELETDYLVARTNRNFKQDQEQVLDISDEEFERSHEHARLRIEHDLENALLAREDAALACLQDGIDPESGRPPPSEYEGEDAVAKSPGSDPQSMSAAPRYMQHMNHYPQVDLLGGITLRVKSSDSSIGEHGGNSPEFQHNIRSWMAGALNDGAEHWEEPPSASEETLPDTIEPFPEYAENQETGTSAVGAGDRVTRRTHFDDYQPTSRSRASTYKTRGGVRRPPVLTRISSESKLSTMHTSDEDLSSLRDMWKRGDYIIVIPNSFKKTSQTAVDALD